MERSLFRTDRESQRLLREWIAVVLVTPQVRGEASPRRPPRRGEEATPEIREETIYALLTAQIKRSNFLRRLVVAPADPATHPARIPTMQGCDSATTHPVGT